MNLSQSNSSDSSLSGLDKKLLQILSKGMPVVEEPWQWLADLLELDKDTVMARVERLRSNGQIKRLGFIVNHHRVGYQTNGMVVWKFDDDIVDLWGERLGRENAVTLCYQRPRRLPDWPYNLFTMIHGQSKDDVLEQLKNIIAKHALADIEYEVLFSVTQLKQQGGRLAG